MPLPTTPTEADYLANFLRTTVGISTAALPDSNVAIDTSYNLALETVNPLINAVSPVLYVQAVYNLAVDILYNIAQDTGSSTYFTDARKTWNIFGFVAGVVSTASDNGTGDSLVVPDSLSQLTLADLQNLKTPWGRAYLAIAQKWGPDLFGIS
jgi:hypothetical protein